MKYRFAQLLAFAFLLFQSLHLAGQPMQGSHPGIHFRAGTYPDALAAAAKAGKPLFVEVHLTGCPHCEALAPVLADKAVGDYFNKQFISWRTEANSKESAAFQKLAGVTYPEFPMLFFFGVDGKLLHMATPSEQPTREGFVDHVIATGKRAFDPAQRTSGYADRFQRGERDLAFLIEYGKYCKATKDVVRLGQVNEALGQLLASPADKTSQAGFYILQRLISDVDNPLSRYFFAHLEEFRAKYPDKDVREAGEAILYHSLYGPKGDAYPASQITRMRHDMVRLGVPEADASARLLLKELDAHLREKNTAAAVSRFNEYRRKATSLSLADYAYLMKFFNEKAPDGSYLPQMPVWAADGLRLAKPEELKTKQAAGLYYELAEAYWKMGGKADASLYASKALETARTLKEPLERYNAQVERIGR